MKTLYTQTKNFFHQKEENFNPIACCFALATSIGFIVASFYVMFDSLMS